MATKSSHESGYGGGSSGGGNPRGGGSGLGGPAACCAAVPLPLPTRQPPPPPKPAARSQQQQQQQQQSCLQLADRQRRLLQQAHRSAQDPLTTGVRCRACGRAFSAYRFLAQHLEARHGGVNDESAKVAQLATLAGRGGGAPPQLPPPLPQFTASDFPELSAAAATTTRAAAAAGLPSASVITLLPTAGSAGQQRKSKQSSSSSSAAAAAAPPPPPPSRPRAGPLAISLVDLVRRPAGSVTSSRLQRQLQQKHAASGVRVSAHGLTVRHGAQWQLHSAAATANAAAILAAAEAQGLRPLRGPGAAAVSSLHRRKKKMSRLRRLVVRERADRRLAAAKHAAERGGAALAQLEVEVEALGGRLRGALDQRDGDAAAAAAASEAAPLESAQVLQLACGKAEAKLAAARGLVRKLLSEQQAAQAAWDVAYGISAHKDGDSSSSDDEGVKEEEASGGDGGPDGVVDAGKQQQEAGLDPQQDAALVQELLREYGQQQQQEAAAPAAAVEQEDRAEEDWTSDDDESSSDDGDAGEWVVEKGVGG